MRSVVFILAGATALIVLGVGLAALDAVADWPVCYVLGDGTRACVDR